MFLKAFIYWTYENTLKNYDAVNCWGIVCCKNSYIEQTHKISTVVDRKCTADSLYIEQTHKISTVVDFYLFILIPRIEQTHKISTVVDMLVYTCHLYIEQTHKISTVVDVRNTAHIFLSNRLIKFLLL